MSLHKFINSNVAIIKITFMMKFYYFFKSNQKITRILYPLFEINDEKILTNELDIIQLQVFLFNIFSLIES